MFGREPSTSTTRSARRAGQRDAIRAVAVVALIAVVALLAVDNRQKVSVGWLVGDGDVPLYQLFVATFLLGIGVGFIARSTKRNR